MMHESITKKTLPLSAETVKYIKYFDVELPS